jgi:hypothetical protein
MKEVLKILVPIGVLLAFFGWLGYAFSGWLFWTLVLSIPVLILGGLQLAYQIDVRLIWMMSDDGQYDNERGLLWIIARKIHRQGQKVKEV